VPILTSFSVLLRFPPYDLDEMKEMEDEIEDLKEGSQAGSVDGQLAGDNKGELEDREHKLEDRENSLLMVRSEARTLVFF
jgi:hypothetical protein